MNAKKLLSLLLAMVMVFAVSTAMADDNYTIAIKNDTEGFTYQAYQIFTGDLSNGTLSNIQWGTGITDAGKNALYTKYNITKAANQTAAKVAEKIVADTSPTTAKDIAVLLAKTTSDALCAPISMTNNDSITVGNETFKGYAATNQIAGWYLVNNTAVPAGNNTYSDYIVQVVDNVAIEPKSDKPSSNKHVDDKNDSDSTDVSILKDSADYDIGDSVPYTLKFKLPSDFAKYSSYAVDFYDDMSKGLTYNNDATIYYGSNDTTGTTIVFSVDDSKQSSYTEGKVYKAHVDNLKTVTPTLQAGDEITIKYTAKLNSDAVIGKDGNPNQYQVEFSNNPNGTGTGTTPWDKNIVFTFKAVFNKVDPDNKPLTGADFTLYKFVQDTNGTATHDGKKGNWTDVTALVSGDIHPTKTKSSKTITEGETETTVSDCVFTFSGLDAGVYKLSETTTPSGYNTMADKIFTINATHDLVSEDPELTSLTTTGDLVISESKSTGTLSADIENTKGSNLPETGGMGTTLLYVGGGILVAAAAILLIFKKRLSVEK